MKIGVISDTHLRVDLAKEAIDRLLSENIDCIFHAGDIGKRRL